MKDKTLRKGESRSECLFYFPVFHYFLKPVPIVQIKEDFTMGEQKYPPVNMEKFVNSNRRKFVRLAEGAELYSIGFATFRKLAYEANAVYRVGRIVLVNLELLEEYLETFHEHNE